MPPQFNRFDGFSIFDDKGEVKRLVEKVIQDVDPDVTIDRMRKINFSYIFILSKKGKSLEVELVRSEIDTCWEWRKGIIDETLQKKITDTIAQF